MKDTIRRRDGRLSCEWMIPLALSGPIVLGGGVGGALLLVWALLRGEAREDEEERAEREAAAQKERERLTSL
jgi:hypothetical protein